MAGQDPTRPLEIDLRRERVLTDTLREFKTRAAGADPRDVSELFSRTAFVANKANVLARAIAEVAQRFSIPVDERAPEIRAAAKRKSSDSSDGSEISFDLFRDAVEVMHRRKERISDLYLTDGVVDPGPVLRKKILKMRARMSSVDPGSIDDNSLELLVSQFFILLLARYLLGLFDGQDHQEFVSQIQGASTQNAQRSITIQIIISVVIQLIIFGVNEALMEKWLDDGSLVQLPPGMKGSTLIAAAKARPLEPIHRLAEIYVGQDDYEQILRYSFEYLERTNEPGYEMWIGYVSAVNARSLAQNLWTYAPAYSVSHAVDGALGRARNRRAGAPDPVGPTPATLKDQIASSLVAMSPDHALVQREALDKISRNLDLTAQVLSAEWIDEIACCLARFLVRVPKDKLKILRGIIHALSVSSMDLMALDLRSLLSNLLSTTVVEVTAQALIYEVERFFDKAASKVLGVFGDDIAVLLCCPLIKELVESVMKLLVDVENRLISLIRQFATSVEAKAKTDRNMYLLLNDRRYSMKLIKIIDRVLQILNDMSICQEDPDPDAMGPRLLDDIKAMGRLPTIRIESGDREKYFSTATRATGNDGREIPALGEEIVGFPEMAGDETYVADGRDVPKSDYCYKVFDDEAVMRVVRGL